MLTAAFIKEKARQYGADLVGIGDIRLYEGVSPREDPRSICPTAKVIIGAAFRIPRGILRGMKNGTQPYAYTSLGLKANSEERTVVFLMKMARIIENEGYEACLQRSCPHMQLRGKMDTNPEIEAVTTLNHTVSVGGGKPEPEILIDFHKAAVVCGMATLGVRGNALTPEFGPFQRFCYIITNAALETDPVLTTPMCDNCGECARACPGGAITMTDHSSGFAGTVYNRADFDSWQCSVYYRGAHRSNPFLPGDFLRDHPQREAILSGTKRFTAEEAKEMYPQLDFLPDTQYGYVPCLCGKRCDLACYRHLEEKGLITKKYHMSLWEDHKDNE